MSYGIKETKEAVQFVVALAAGVKASRADGKLDVSDLGNFVGALSLAPAAITNVQLVAKEVRNLDEAEKTELKAIIGEGVEDEVLQRALDAFIDLADAIVELAGLDIKDGEV